jgi:hypothetical protein
MTSVLIVLELISVSLIRVGIVPITLSLAPIVIGAAIYGWKGGAFLGFIFSLVVYISGLFGGDGGYILSLISFNGAISAIATPILIIVKGTAAGFIAGLIYKPIEKRNSLLAVICAGILAPLTNTGIYVLGMITIFRGTVLDGSGLSPLVIVISAIWVNFVIELMINLILSVVITRIISIAKNHKFNV